MIPCRAARFRDRKVFLELKNENSPRDKAVVFHGGQNMVLPGTMSIRPVQGWTNSRIRATLSGITYKAIGQTYLDLLSHPSLTLPLLIKRNYDWRDYRGMSEMYAIS